MKIEVVLPARYKRVAEVDFHVSPEATARFGAEAIDDASRTALFHLMSDELAIVAVGAHVRRVKLNQSTKPAAPGMVAHFNSWRWILSVEVLPEGETIPSDIPTFDHKMDELP